MVCALEHNLSTLFIEIIGFRLYCNNRQLHRKNMSDISVRSKLLVISYFHYRLSIQNCRNNTFIIYAIYMEQLNTLGLLCKNLKII